MVDVARLAPSPVPPGDRAETLIDVVVDGNAFKRRDGQIAHEGTIGFPKRSDVDGHDSASYAPSHRVAKGLSAGCELAGGYKPCDGPRRDCVARSGFGDRMKGDLPENQAKDCRKRIRAVSPDTVLYSCPHCRVELEAHFDEWEGWLRCPVCARPSIPPEPVGLRKYRQRLAASTGVPLEQAAALQPGDPTILDGARPAITGRFAHTSPARLVVMTGFVFSLLLTLIAFLDQKPTRLAIFGFSSFAFFLVLCIPRNRVARRGSRLRNERGTMLGNDE